MDPQSNSSKLNMHSVRHSLDTLTQKASPYALKAARHTIPKRKPKFKLKLPSSNSFFPIPSSEESPKSYGNEIIPGLYITDISQASSEEFIAKNKITAMVTLSNQEIPVSIRQKLREYKFIKILDNCQANIQSYFEECFRFIEENLKNDGRVVVHCQAGISRSPTIVMAYLMKKWECSWSVACNYVQKKRSCAAPNFSFIGQLLNFESILTRLKTHKV